MYMNIGVGAGAMGILGHGDMLRGKYLTAVVLDRKRRAHFVPIKHTIGDYFLARIGDDLYGFSLKDAEYYSVGDVGSKMAKFVLYSTAHTRPMNTSKLEKIGRTLAAIGVSRIDRQMLRLLSLLGRAEARRRKAIYDAAEEGGEKGGDKAAAKWDGHNLKAVADTIQANPGQWPELAGKLADYINELGIEKISVPVQEIASYIERDLNTTDPTFLGELCSRFSRVDLENRAMTNVPRTSSTAWLKWAVLMGGVLMVMVVVGMGVSEGWFDSLGSFIPSGLDASTLGQAFNPNALGGQALQQIGGAAGVDCSAEGIQGRYASPLDLKIAVQTGTETCELPESIEASLEHVQAPVATAVPAEGAAVPAPAPAPAPAP